MNKTKELGQGGSSGPRGPGESATFQFTAGTWTLKKTVNELEFECPSPPTQKGLYEGEMRKVAGVRRNAVKSLQV
jgi:hypothetical protein